MKNKTIHFLNKSLTRTKALALGVLMMAGIVQITNAQCTDAASLIPIQISGSTTVNGVTVTTTSTSGVLQITSDQAQILNCIPGNYPDNPLLYGGTLTMNFNKPVNNIVFFTGGYGSVYSPSATETLTFTTNNGTPVVSANGSTCYNITAVNNTITGRNGNSSASNLNGGFFKVTAPSSFTQLVISGGSNALLGVFLSLCGASVTEVCSAGTTAPPLNATTLSNVCSATTVNLNSLHSATEPIGSSIVWFDNNLHTGTAIANPAAVAASGTYYAFYYNSVSGGCYSPASNAVTVTINNCCAA